MLRGSPLPAIVIEDKTKRILAGVNRYLAAKDCNFTSIDAYLVNGPSVKDEENPTEKEKENLLKYEASIENFVHRDNTLHGENINEEEQILSCVEEHIKFNRSIKGLCDSFFGSQRTDMLTKLQAACSARKVSDRLAQLGVSVPDKAATTTLTSMYIFLKDDTILKGIGNLAGKFKLPQVKVKEIVDGVRELGTEDERVEFIKKKYKELDAASNRVIVPVAKPQKDLFKVLVTFKNNLETGYVGSNPFPPIDTYIKDPNELKVHRELITKIIDMLKVMKQKTH